VRNAVILISIILPAGASAQESLCDPCLDGPEMFEPGFNESVGPRNLRIITPEDLRELSGAPFNLGSSISSLRGLSSPAGARTLTLIDSRRCRSSLTLPAGPSFRFGDADDLWYGTPAFAVLLPADAAYAVGENELRWYSDAFDPAQMARLDVTIDRLDGETDAAVSAPAYAEPLERAQMLTRIDLPEPGCWEVTAELEGLGLRFVIESVDR